MAQWLAASRFTAKTPKNEISLALQSLCLELHGDPSCVPKEDEVKGALLCTVGLCHGEAQLQVKWCQLSVLALNRVKCTFTPGELNECTSFILDVCKATNYVYHSVEALGALLYDVDLNVSN
eukprot:sb/3475950/